MIFESQCVVCRSKLTDMQVLVPRELIWKAELQLLVCRRLTLLWQHLLLVAS